MTKGFYVLESLNSVLYKNSVNERAPRLPGLHVTGFLPKGQQTMAIYLHFAGGSCRVHSISEEDRRRSKIQFNVLLSDQF